MTNQIKPAGIPPQYIVPHSFREFSRLVAMQSTRTGGISSGPYSSLNLGINTEDSAENVHQNTLLLCSAIGIDPERMVSSVQIHGTEILVAEKPGRERGFDAFITDKKDLFLSIFTADCYPVLIFDPRHQASGAVHAGWKGSAGRIVMKTISAMQKNFNSIPSECFAWIGTGISSAAYEVGPEVADAFSSEFLSSASPSGESDKRMLDLRLVNYRQLLVSGIPSSNIEQSQFCSSVDSGMFFSYRRDNGTTGRMVSMIGVRSL
jgi:YfiH family protein